MGKYILIGITFLNSDGGISREEQLHGVIESATLDGILVSPSGAHEGESWTMPPMLSAIRSRSLAYTPTMDESRQFVEFHLSNDTLRRSKVAVVVSKVVDYRMANMFSTLCDLGVLRSSASDRSLKLKIG